MHTHVVHVEQPRSHPTMASPTLSKNEITRYSRQLILPQFGLESQKKLKHSKVLIVGLGGLGSPAASYLSGAGVGELGLMDSSAHQSSIDVTNLHRQLPYTEQDASQSLNKPDTLATYLKQRNTTLKISTHRTFITPANSVETVSRYDAVLDCTDNVRARYVIGDACAAANVPLISGAAIALNGQLSVHLPASLSKGCYRCFFPRAPPPQCAGTCDAAGVLGPVPGVIGNLMAIECIKVLTQFEGAVAMTGRLLVYDAANGLSPFRTVRMRESPRSDCIACGDTTVRMDVKRYDYDQFLGLTAPLETGSKTRLKRMRDENADGNGNGVIAQKKEKLPRISVYDLNRIRRARRVVTLNLDLSSDSQPDGNVETKTKGEVVELPLIEEEEKEKGRNGYVLIDVRPHTQYAVSHLEGSINIPVENLTSDAERVVSAINALNNSDATVTCICICRRG